MQFLLCLNFVSLFWTEHRIEGVLFLIEEDFGKVLLGVVHLLRGAVGCTVQPTEPLFFSQQS